jgi:fatty-acyl-CoA synthase
VPGDHVAILGPTEPRLITIDPGLLVGRRRQHGAPVADAHGIARRVRRGDSGPDPAWAAPKLVLVDDVLAAFYEGGARRSAARARSAVVLGGRVRRAAKRRDPAPDPERLVILQYTSGSTSEPKGVMIPTAVLAANIDACARGGDLSIDGRHGLVAAALPRHGLVGFLAIPMTTGGPSCRPRRRTSSPIPAMDAVDVRHSAAPVTAGPNFAGCWPPSAAADERISTSPPDPRRAVGRRAVDPAAVERSSRRPQPFGFRSGRRLPAFGMAEVAIGGAFTADAAASCATPSTASCSSATRRSSRGGVDPDDEAFRRPRLPLLGAPGAGLSCASSIPSRTRRSAERHVGELLHPRSSVTPGTTSGPTHRRALPRRVAAHGDLGLPARR